MQMMTYANVWSFANGSSYDIKPVYILWTDEAAFTLNSRVNRQDFVYREVKNSFEGLHSVGIAVQYCIPMVLGMTVTAD